MALWHRSWRADLALRTLGLLLCGLAGAAIAQLVARLPVAGRTPDGVVYALAAAAFLAASTGSTLAALGRRLFDPVATGERWRAASHHAFCPSSETMVAILPCGPAHDLPEQESVAKWSPPDVRLGLRHGTATRGVGQSL